MQSDLTGRGILTMRKRIYSIIEVASDGDKISAAYDILMLCAIIISIIPLAFKQSNIGFYIIDIVTAMLFIIDYVLKDL